MGRFEWIEKRLSALKTWEQRVYAADYRYLAFKEGWKTRPVTAPYREKVLVGTPSEAQVRSIVVFKPDDMGDAIHSLPAINKLRARFPNAAFRMICQDLTRPIFERTGWFEEIASVKPKKRWIRFVDLDLAKEIKQFSHPDFDLAVFLRTYPAYFRSFLQIPARYHLHPEDPRLTSMSTLRAQVSLWGPQREHQAVQMMEIVGRMTGETYSYQDIKYPTWNWNFDDKLGMEKIFGDGPTQDYLVVHPFNKYETKRYMFWKEIVESLKQQYSIPIVVVGGSEDPQLDWEGVYQLQGKLTVGQLGYVLARAKAFLGNESGPAHWAGALGTPSVVLFGGHSLAREWAPLGDTLLLRTEVSCSPCHKRVCPGLGVKCLVDLRPNVVLPEIHQYLTAKLGSSVRHQAAVEARVQLETPPPV